MKNYCKNKDFIPKNFSLEAERKRGKSNSNNMVYFLILNALILPGTIEKMSKPKEVESCEVVEFDTYISSESICEWLGEIDNDIYYMNIYNGQGEVGVLNKSKIYSIEDKNDFKIVSMKKDEDNRYIISINKEDVYE